MRPERLGLGPERLDLRPERLGLRPEGRVEGGWGPWYKIPNQVLVPISKSNLMFLKVFKTGPKTKIQIFKQGPKV